MRYSVTLLTLLLFTFLSGFAQSILKTKTTSLEIGFRHNIESNLVRLDNGAEYFQILDIAVNKTIQLVTLEGVKAQTVDISKVLNKVERFGGINCINLNQFLITDNNNNSVFIFNEKGIVTDSFNLADVLSEHLGGNNCLFVKPKVYNRKLYVMPLWVSSEEYTSLSMRNFMTEDFKKFLTIHSKISSELPLMYQIDLSSKQSKPIFKDYYQTFFKNGDFIPTNHFPNIDFADEYLFVSSVYGNKLCKFNLSNGKKSVKEIKTVDDLNGMPINVNKPNIKLSPDLVYRKFAREYLMEEGYISRVVFDSHKKLICLLVKHEFEDAEGIDLKRDYRFGKKTLLVLDMNMKLVAQKTLTDKEYSGMLWATKSGLALSMKNPRVADYDPTISKIQLFEVQK